MTEGYRACPTEAISNILDLRGKSVQGREETEDNAKKQAVHCSPKQTVIAIRLVIVHVCIAP